MVMGSHGAQNEEWLCWRDQQQFSLVDRQQDDLINLLLFFKNNETKLEIYMDVFKDFQG
jgi:hypothetical protein